MSSTQLLKEACQLPIPERLELIDQLIESVEQDSTECLSPEMEAELDRRCKAQLANPKDAEPWEVVRERIQRSLDATASRRTA